ncbi:bifunctional (p)ppGpp synthetase/guanosine-3',5'-bis(diphosphate) 3'-pyrophosphohydrolase [Geobacter sulfurreducens]|jgi:guanosine-3',5'-bis(diphosphate) 3'-pyrophosphohydrolase|uniref:GTP/GDP 3'-pyrophosphokinase and (P)ppGpp 3'-pyrophosphohydrolase n=1 Tax=Geobacter sulfurreducens (strain ATCC 51573 / DSM 12127 / PCA) TaxID=243231 RepID=Q74AW3_GEOSL|nr:bifunctional (p)ppGpp synthetase/guanosine-3',5'-bis(diphosphate) 3'-pyrophosphohydrolase [Geobacter sulfurreducens]AAR35612.1 GTP/GDP 3'-pyrophosphokinase and (p)ppGpp 3'-pyrophosphohydrolase [Geobacter sulfurreducens PCA]ADI84994.1 GTP/GDP 3'-pyrophosphokinase and (p)ppGpp 3'-pyrophosphohydrolase [Geobacter sulfurreducens KN400]AJY68474.1 GTP pyrophosphokinase [Geobacter sulfurreducens]QVW34093.1 bifunctional (p)ppGpp synthetase/guanosine-3',5'-bis(diphosphate) 3'-pyrophosphohydrolase [Geo
MIRLNDILDKVVTYNPVADLDLIRKAYVYCAKVHQGQTRLSGEPYLVHPMEVAGVLADLKLDVPTVVTGLLHDTIEDTLTTREELEGMFGAEVANLVDGVTKIGKIHFKTKEESQAENFRKMLLAMANDIRVILVKLADRLHNMRTLQYQPEPKQRSISRETLDIYAPLANRLGISWIKSELEDLSFRYLEPQIYYDLASKVAKKKKERESYVEEVRQIIVSKLAEHDLKGDVFGRSKHLYSIWRKMQARNVDIDQIYDLVAIRVMVNDIRECYEVLGIIHSTWKPIPGRFKDYIAMPKGNMYQSLHTTVIGPHGERMEVQIRTSDMHRVAEAGIAAHWKYKEGKGYDEKEVKRFAWLRQLLEWQQELQDSHEFMNTVKVELFPEEVYVFTPRGDVKSFPKGSTPIDLAYTIHTDIGHRCVGAKVNGKLVPLKYELKNGDIVEVITSPHHTPSKDWLKIVKSSRARNKIRAWIKTEERVRSISLGKEILEKEFRRYSLNLAKLQKAGEIKRVASEFGLSTDDDVMAAVGYGKLSANQVIGKLLPEEKLQERQEQKESRIGKMIGKLTGSSPSAIQIGGVDDVLVRFGKCCNPVPGDDIIGFITRGRGVTIHTADCPVALENDPERRIAVTWNRERKAALPVKIRVSCHDQKGILANITQAITDCEANISSASIQSTVDKRGVNIFEVDVTDLDHLKRVMNNIMKLSGVISVERMKN